MTKERFGKQQRKDERRICVNFLSQHTTQRNKFWRFFHARAFLDCVILSSLGYKTRERDKLTTKTKMEAIFTSLEPEKFPNVSRQQKTNKQTTIDDESLSASHQQLVFAY